MAATRVLIVDDSVVVRKILSDAFAGDPAFEVAGTAATGAIALQKIPQVNPDVVILDVNMPDMDGLETVRRMHAGWPRLPVIMCSALTEQGAETSIKALSLGASDCITKPSSFGLNGAANLANFHIELRAKVLALAGRPVAAARMLSMVPNGLSMMPAGLSRMPFGLSTEPPGMPVIPRAPALPSMSPRTSGLRAPVSAIGIGSSTGGPNALGTLFAGMPRDLPVPIFIVQHMPPLFTKLLAERLAATCGLVVHEATDGQPVVPGEVFVAPGNFHMTVVRDGHKPRISLNQETPECSCRPAIDVLFRSLAHIYGSGVLAAVMTGMGKDGTRGARHVVDAGGAVMVQDSASSVVPSMPESVIAAGVPAQIYPLDRLAHELVRRTRGLEATNSFRRNEISP